MAVTFTDRRALQRAGFVGFETISGLRESGLATVPPECGVYMVVRDPCEAPAFRVNNPGGRFKGKNPTVSAETIRAAWVEGVCVLYIGKAGGSGGATLRSRLRQLLDFGAGKPIGHWGGRYLWQLKGINKALVCWRVCPEDEIPREVERTLIAEFAAGHGKRPYANLRG